MYLTYSLGMPRTDAPLHTTNGPRSAYAVLRHGGASPGAAGLQLGLGARAASRLERAFQAKAARGADDAAVPKFARHHGHVAAVMGQGGYPALTERRCGRNGAQVCLPLVWPIFDPFDGRTGK